MVTSVDCEYDNQKTVEALSLATANTQAIILHNPHIDIDLVELLAKGTKAITRGLGKNTKEIYFQPTKKLKLSLESTHSLQNLFSLLLVPACASTSKNKLTIKATKEIDRYRELILPFLTPYVHTSFIQQEGMITITMQGQGVPYRQVEHREILVAIRGVIYGEQTDRIRSILDLSLKELNAPVSLMEKHSEQSEVILVGLFGDFEGYDPVRPMVAGNTYKIASEADIPSIIERFKEDLKLKEILPEVKNLLNQLSKVEIKQDIPSIDDI